MGDQSISDGSSFPRMLAIFFAVFHPTAGPSVIYQVPTNFVGSPSNVTADHTYNVNMDCVSEYVIPKRQLCDRIISVCNSGYRIIGYPIHMEGAHYERNAFIFNCCVVFNESDDVSAYKPVVYRLAQVLKSMEELKRSLSTEGERGVVLHVIEQVLEDLNNYCECMIPIIDEEVTLNIKLFPQYKQPMRVKDWHVPIPTVRLDSLVDANWDLTMQKLIPHIDGIASVRQISELADVDPVLVSKCMEHLVYYNCLLTTDIFQFSGIYAVTPELNSIVNEPSLQEECCLYVALPNSSIPDFATIFCLYTSLRQGLVLKDWLKLHILELVDIDLRRFISFGVIKGFLYRVHSYPCLPQDARTTKLTQMADGSRHMDEICTVLSRPYNEVLSELKAAGQVQIIYR